MGAENHKWHEKLNTDRTCSKCGQFKQASEFHKRRYMCKSCERSMNREWEKKNPERFEALRRKGQLKRYGITPEKYEDMLIAQNGGCAVCGVSTNQPFNYFSVDHDHSTGKVRGLLCTNCNAMIGHAKERPEVLEGAVRYLRNMGSTNQQSC